MHTIFRIIVLLMISQSIYGHSNPYMAYVPKAKDPCSGCPTPCPKPAIEELENLPFEADQSYKRKKEILHAGKEKLSLEDLEELKEAAKNAGDLETFAEAHHRIKIEVSTEDGGKTLVLKLKEVGLPVAGIAIVSWGLGAFANHCINKK